MRPSDKMLHNFYYAMPRVASLSLITPLTIVQGVYAKNYGMELTSLALVILFVRMFDAIIDPVVGYLSDIDRAKRGTRKPFMILGALVLIISAYFLYSPPDNVSVLYFSVWFTLIYLGFTLFEIPHLAWGGEISNHSHEKTQTYNFRTAAAYFGLALFYGVPLLPIWQSSEITPETLQFSSIVSGLLMLPLLYFCMRYVPNGSSYTVDSAQNHKNTVSGNVSSDKSFRTTTNGLRLTGKSIIYNKPLVIFFTAFLFAGLGLGMWLGLLFIYIDTYLNRGDIFAEIYLISCIIGVFSAGVWVPFAKRLGKKVAWLAAVILGIGCFILTGLLNPENVTYWSLLILLALKSLFFVGMESMPQSILSDIIDYTTLKFKVFRGSTYFSLFLFIYKGAAALGAAFGLAIAGWYGFDPSALIHNDSGVFGLILAMSWIPSALTLTAIFFIYLSPITAQRHKVIRRRLDALETRLRQHKESSTPDSNVRAMTLSPPNN